MSRDRYGVFREFVCTYVLAVLLGFMMFSPTASGQTVTLTMDDLGVQPVDGLMHPTGVNFAFTIDGLPSNAATYGGNGPGMTLFVDDPSIEGSTNGVLTIEFPEPSSVVEFGIALLGTGSITNAVEVELLSTSGEPLFSGGLDFEVAEDFTETRFVYSGNPVATAIVDFTPASTMMPVLPRFAFDNLTFVLPEPSSLIMICGTIMLALGNGVRLNRE